MSQSIKLIVGLGNPGGQYAYTRHNAGALFVDALAEQLHATFKMESKFHGEYCKVLIDQHPVHLLKPTTFMNRSGQAVQAIASFFKIDTNEILVAHDDIDLPTGVVKLKKSGGHGGQNGLRDIIEKLGGQNDFKRLRLGIGHPGHASKVTGYVLSTPGKKENEVLTASREEALQTLPEITSGDWQKAVQRLHSYSP